MELTKIGTFDEFLHGFLRDSPDHPRSFETDTRDFGKTKYSFCSLPSGSGLNRSEQL